MHLNMLKSVLLLQKTEKEKILSKKLIKRDSASNASQFFKSPLIKVISGPRRAGKSTFALQSTPDAAYANFDDENLVKAKNYEEIIAAINEIYPNAKTCLFDEIQNLDNWELFCNKLSRRGYDLILTGSNAKLLSGELATSLTGRFVEKKIYQLNFNEFLRIKNYDLTQEKMPSIATQGFLTEGGFPEIQRADVDKNAYLSTLADAVIYNDVVKRHRVRFPGAISSLFNFLLSNFSSLLSFTQCAKMLEFDSVHTAQKYFQYLEEAYLIFNLNKFSYKMKEQIKSPKKVYVIDNGYISAKSSQFFDNSGRLLENAVATELLRLGYSPSKNYFYYKTKNNLEVDFVLKNNLKIDELLQVTWELNLKNEKREIKALLEASEETNCSKLTVVTAFTEKEMSVGHRQIQVVPFWKWASGARRIWQSNTILENAKV